MLPKKVLGQHFLKNPSLLEKLTELAGVCKDDVVVEIGAGKGDLTAQLVRKAKFVYSYELDQNLYKMLTYRFSSTGNIKIVHSDFLKHDFGEIFKECKEKLKIVANIPYKITTPLLLKFVKDIEYIKDCNILLQKEVAERITAEPGNKNYGSLTVLLHTYFSIKVMKYIKPGAFIPPPKVDSAFVKITPLNRPLIGREKATSFSRFLRICFSMRRKTIQNILKSIKEIKRDSVSEFLEILKISPDARPESLTVQNFLELFDMIN